MNALLEITNLNVFDGRKKLLSNINLVLNRGEIVTLIGPNGAGKSTLVETIIGVRKAKSGRLTKADDLRIGYMPQKLTIDSTLPLTVERFLQLANKDAKSITQALLDVDVEKLKKQTIHSISGGELQRVMLARALLRKPNLLVLDEPVQGVDINGQTALYDLISEIRNRINCGVLLISHDLHVVMAKTDRVICLNHHICCHGHPDDIGKHPAYLELFGERDKKSIALYQHHHDHHHDLQGNVISDEN